MVCEDWHRVGAKVEPKGEETMSLNYKRAVVGVLAAMLIVAGGITTGLGPAAQAAFSCGQSYSNPCVWSDLTQMSPESDLTSTRSGWMQITAPATGSYTFQMYGNDAYLTTYGTSVGGFPYSRVYAVDGWKLLASTGSSNQISANLVAGQKYAIEAWTGYYYRIRWDGWEYEWEAVPIYSHFTVSCVAHPPFPSPTAYTVTYDFATNGGTSATASTASKTAGAAVDLTPTAVKPGWQFVGWNTDKTATTGLGSLAMPSGNVRLYAIFKQIVAVYYNVTYDHLTNGGGIIVGTTKTSDRVAAGQPVDLSVVAKRSNAWVFVGWNTNKDATTGLTSLTMPSSDLTLYAIFKRTLTATFVDYSGTVMTTRTQSATIYNRAATSASFAMPAQNTYSGWTSLGWWYVGQPYDKGVAPGGSVTIADNTTFYGKYKKMITLSYNANGGSSTPAPVKQDQYVRSDDITKPNMSYGFWVAPAITKPGATFDGWALDSPTGPKYAANSGIALTKDSTLYATWR